MPKAHSVVVVFKERRYDGSPKIWVFSGIHAMAIVKGRLHLMREGYGLVCDIPYEEIEQVYGAAEGTLLHVA